MAPHGGPRGGGSEEDDIDHKSVKHLLDSIGKDVYDQVKNDAQTYKGELEGNLSFASIFDTETTGSLDPCSSDYTTRFDARGDPCKKDAKGIDVDRFSVKEQAEYDNKKIKCSNGGACAPFRRLHLCNKNMEKIATSTTSDTLLAEVCYAAKYEGNSIKTHYPKYDAEYSSGSGFTLCTMLARSFADIGDIIRGRDLYRGGNTKEKNRRDKLEDNLKTIFGKIHDRLDKKDRYNDDTENYFQLREDWWTANRATVWKAITCNAQGNTYFHATCDSADGKSQSQATKQCRCDKDKGAKDGDQVPTYFDYVPQYLRWFEEWAEDFCRKKKKYVDIVKTYCRGVYNKEPRYCSRNGCDCTKTVRAKEVNSGSASVPGGGASVPGGGASVPGGGASGDSSTSGTNDINNGTFYRSDYCQPCPICGVKKKRNGDSGNQWEEKHESTECTSINLYKPKGDATPTEIKILKSGENRDDIRKKIDEFCAKTNSDRSDLYDPWKCYKGEDVEIDGKDEEDDEEDVQKVKDAGGLYVQ
ncbi:hypothetical protein PFTANZ_06098 [Plasmodium falciparum Tanzania (2000708)]|uniref:Uncharacterized protein n=1 Tax=Plasmodium falciparum Tanzania (2000708) TaxID=1036725 RepID=A0A024VY46_PLAFA|nr:hypothetical protein PFTANZ_06098 [Plasmodium falciparum Tanzania (2000708)]